MSLLHKDRYLDQKVPGCLFQSSHSMTEGIGIFWFLLGGSHFRKTRSWAGGWTWDDLTDSLHPRLPGTTPFGESSSWSVVTTPQPRPGRVCLLCLLYLGCKQPACFYLTLVSRIETVFWFPTQCRYLEYILGKDTLSSLIILWSRLVTQIWHPKDPPKRKLTEAHTYFPRPLSPVTGSLLWWRALS